ncbi:MAG: MlaD family protein [Myxococcota bacterium]|jgi:ABC-type transporter Mla subunit MlaD|nr:MlaD family protein [Myxococcota bacterium]
MSASRAQKLRLGIFLLISGGIFVITMIALVGSSLLERRDTYIVRIEGSISGLEKGAQVRYNGIRVGRVDDMELDRDNPGQVVLTLSLEEGTPVTRDTVAVLNMQGITGLKVIELSGGDESSDLLEPGSEIPAGGSDFDLLTERAVSIAAKIESLLDNLVEVTGGESLQRINGVLANTQKLLETAEALLAENRPGVQGVISSAELSTQRLAESIAELRETMSVIRMTVASIATWVDPAQVRAVLNKTSGVLDEAKQRLGPDEFGQTIAATNTLLADGSRLVNTSDMTLRRTRDDLRRIFDELVTSSENLSDFSQMLLDNPSVLISGRSESERPLP